MRAGLVPTPLNTRLTTPELVRFLEPLDPGLVVTEVCVYGAADDYWGERVEAAVVVAPGATACASA